MNRARYSAVLDHIRDNPDQWDQEDRFKCVAGHAVSLFGTPQERAHVLARNPMFGEAQCAQRLLELTDADADKIFDPGTTITELEAGLK